MKLPVPIRLLKDRYFGESSRSEAFAKGRLAELSAYMEPEVASIAERAVVSLSAYQDPDYALLYLERLARYVGPKKAGCPFLSELAVRMDRRMRFDDVAALAMRALETGERSPAGAVCLIDMVGMLPPNAADQVTPVLSYLGWSRRAMSVSFDGSTPGGRKKAGTYALLKRVRMYSKRARIERAWVERWLHMVDRTMLKQHDAAVEVIRSADLINGTGATYHEGLDRWHAIVDRLIKPACDGVLCLENMAGTVQQAVKAAGTIPDSRQFDHLLVEIIGENAEAGAN
ncbi:MAG: hypothetical protein K2W78_10465 [Xanthobacteraceae bacterium]|nr:hypothetical protein [Xanthobacteraceae bacterium]